MSFVRFAGGHGLVWRPQSGIYDYLGGWLTFGAPTLNASGESVGMIGHLHWDDEAQHTVSSAGGKIWWQSGGSNTFNDAGSEFRVGIQDVSGTVEDGTFDVHAALVGGTDSITAFQIRGDAMESGSKVIAHRALVAVVMEFTTRAGTDSIQVARMTATAPAQGLPYCTTDSGSGPVRDASMPWVLVESDDGHYGFFHPVGVPFGRTVTSYHSGTNPDEHGLIFRVPWKCKVNQLWMNVEDLDTDETGVLRLYSDPEGSPSVLASFSHDGDLWANNGATEGCGFFPIDEVELSPGVDYCVGYEATSATDRGLTILSAQAAGWRKTQWLGDTMRGVSRNNAAGGSSPAFGSSSTTQFPALGVVISAIDIPTGGGGVRGRGGAG